jgi:hypothetical protein
VPEKVVQQLLGHASGEMTSDVYGHFVPGLLEKYVAELDAGGLQQTAGEWQEWQESNPRPAVLETAALPS